MIDGKRGIQVEFRAKIMNLVVSKQLLGFPNDGEFVVRPLQSASNEKDNALTIPRKGTDCQGVFPLNLQSSMESAARSFMKKFLFPYTIIPLYRELYAVLSTLSPYLGEWCGMY